jgi:hypothetical protein
MRFEISWTKLDKLTPNNKEAGPFARPASAFRDQIVAAIVSVVVAPFAGTLIVPIGECTLVLVARGMVVVGTPAMIWYDKVTLSVVELDRLHE